MAGIFISYRRADSEYAVLLYPWLIQRFGPELVFWDWKDIEGGEKFAEVIEQQIRSSQVFIALIARNWLFATDDHGARRIDSADDWIRRETVLALQAGIPVIPVLAGVGAPAANDLPDELKGIAALHMLEMRDMRFNDLLLDRLERLVPAAPAEPVSGDTSIRLQRRAANLLRRQIQRLQVRAVELVQDGKADRARDEVQEGSELLMALLDLLPGDTLLDAQLGYLFGTLGQALHQTGDSAQAERYYDMAMIIFARVQSAPAALGQDRQAMASAIKGIGGVYYAKGDHQKAVQYCRAALELEPTYCYAWHDLFAAYDGLARQGEIHLQPMRQALERTRATGAGLPGLGADHLAMFDRLMAHWESVAERYPHLLARDEPPAPPAPTKKSSTAKRRRKTPPRSV